MTIKASETGWFDNLSIKRKVLAGSCAIIVLMLLIGGMSTYRLYKLNDTVDVQQLQAAQRGYLKEAFLSMVNIRLNALRHVLTSDAGDMAALEQEIDQHRQEADQRL